jgi:hypothetical protein
MPSLKPCRPWCRALAVVACSAFLAKAAFAGQSCEDKPLGVAEARKSFGLALKVREALDQSGAQVALLGRVGQDISKYGLHYSHVGFVWRDHPEGRWLSVHLLNECGTAVSNLYSQGLANFFADDMVAWDALLLIPSPEVQQRLAAHLNGEEVLRLHQARYNMVAYPFSSQYQNSNQWALEILAESLAGKSFARREEAQRWLKEAGYRPSTLKIPMLTRLGGRMFKANVAFDDHPTDRRMAGQIDTVTVDSIADFLSRVDSAGQRKVISF